MSLTPEQFKAWRDEQKTSHRYRLRPHKGYVSNPLRSYQRNAPCLCGSGDKWKHCCLSTQPLFIHESELKEHQMVLDGIEVPREA